MDLRKENDGFIIDFFELMFLAESVIPQRPIARSMCFDDFSERHYNKMNDNQRLQFFEHVQKCHGFTLENEQCRHFFARFNPKNQYLVSCFHNGKAEAIQCYMFDEEYRTSKNRFVNRDYIKSVVRMHDSQTIICPVWDYEAQNYQFITTFNTRTNVEFTTKPQMGYSTC
jgi:hypothetical protein